jgi:hypothetical protein
MTPSHCLANPPKRSDTAQCPWGGVKGSDTEFGSRAGDVTRFGLAAADPHADDDPLRKDPRQ